MGKCTANRATCAAAPMAPAQILNKWRSVQVAQVPYFSGYYTAP